MKHRPGSIQIFRMRDVGNGEIQQIGPGVAEVLTEGWIDLLQTAIRKGRGHSGGGMLENGAEPLHAMLLNAGQVGFGDFGCDLEHIHLDSFLLVEPWPSERLVRPGVEVLAAKEKPPKTFPLQKKQKARLPSEDEPISLSRGKTFFGNPAIRATHARGGRGPVALRPRISPGLLLSESYIWYGIALPSQSVVVKEWGRGRCLRVGSGTLFNC
jgi:hypothetical protein